MAIEALERLIDDLENNFSKFNIPFEKGKEFPMAQFDLNDAKQNFYDPEHCDNLTAEQKTQLTTDKTWVDANNSPFRDNVGRALYNVALRALAMTKSPSATKGTQDLKFVDENYRYCDSALSRAPLVVDSRTLAFAETYKVFTDTMVKLPDPLSDAKKNAGFVVRLALESNTATTIQGFKSAQAILDERIFLYKARLNESLMNRSKVQDEFEKLKSPALEARNKYNVYSELAGQIDFELTKHPERKSDESYLKTKIAELKKLLDAPLTAHMLEQDILNLEKGQANIPSNPIFLAQNSYFDEIFTRRVAPIDAFAPMRSLVVDEYATSVDELKRLQNRIPQTIKVQQNMIAKLESLLVQLELQKLRVNVMTRVTLQTPPRPIDQSSDNIETLKNNEKIIKTNLTNLGVLLNVLDHNKNDHLSSLTFTDKKAQDEYRQGVIAIFDTTTRDIRKVYDEFVYEEEKISTKLRTVQLEATHGDDKALVDLKQKSDRAIGLARQTLHGINDALKASSTEIAMANNAIDLINQQYDPQIAVAQAEITRLNTLILWSGVSTPVGQISDLTELHELMERLETAQDTLRTASLPIDETVFNELAEILNWDSDDIGEWEYIQNPQSFFNSFTNALGVTATPQELLFQGVQQRIKRIIEATDFIEPLFATMRTHQQSLDNISAQKKHTLALPLQRIVSAELAREQLEKEKTPLEIDISYHEKMVDDATAAFESSLRQCIEDVAKPNLTHDDLKNVRELFNGLLNSGKDAFAIFLRQNPDLKRTFNTHYSVAEAALQQPNA
nr:hypothetical protein [Pseudomonadota bacterium]